jgi:hypothetical protein
MTSEPLIRNMTLAQIFDDVDFQLWMVRYNLLEPSFRRLLFHHVQHGAHFLVALEDAWRRQTSDHDEPALPPLSSSSLESFAEDADKIPDGCGDFLELDLEGSPLASSTDPAPIKTPTDALGRPEDAATDASHGESTRHPEAS